VDQKSKLEISNTSLISRNDNMPRGDIKETDDTPYYLSTIALLETKLSDLDMQTT